MSNYHLKAIEDETGKTFLFEALDDCYGQHNYGYRNTKDGKMYTESEFNSKFRRVTDSLNLRADYGKDIDIRERAIKDFEERYKDLDKNTFFELRDFLADVIDFTKQQWFKEGQKEYRQFILNILDGYDEAEGHCNTKSIRFAINNKLIE